MMKHQAARHHTIKGNTTLEPRPKADDAHPVDKHVGQRIRICRINSKASQSDVAKEIGISFQQLQKYENGRNRVSASMLYELASCLRTPVGTFFEGLPEPEKGRAELTVTEIDERIAYIGTSEGRQLIEDVLQLSPRVRSKVAALVSSIAYDERCD